METKLRIDKWLWAVRIYKTRSLAADECSKGHVTIDSMSVKPSKEIKGGETIVVKKGLITRHYLVKGIIAKRMSAQLVQEYIEDVTPVEILEIENNINTYGFEIRDRGIGRPTKKDRRMIDKLKDVDQ